jgi:hypothetical protein
MKTDRAELEDMLLEVVDRAKEKLGSFTEEPLVRAAAWRAETEALKILANLLSEYDK